MTTPLTALQEQVRLYAEHPAPIAPMDWQDLMNAGASRHGPGGRAYAAAVHGLALHTVRSRTGAVLRPSAVSVDNLAVVVGDPSCVVPFPTYLVLLGPEVLVMVQVAQLGRNGEQPQMLDVCVVQGTCACGGGLTAPADTPRQMLTALELLVDSRQHPRGLAGVPRSVPLGHLGQCRLDLTV